MKLSVVVAVAENGCIGRDGELPWRLPDDLKRFKQITMGKPIIMGRKTWKSIGRPLPGRRNIVVTAQAGYEAPGCECVRSLDEALALVADAEEACIIGGARLFAESLPKADLLYFTRVHAEVNGDVFCPVVPWENYTCEQRERHPADDRHEHAFTFEVWQRK